MAAKAKKRTTTRSRSARNTARRPDGKPTEPDAAPAHPVKRVTRKAPPRKATGATGTLRARRAASRASHAAAAPPSASPAKQTSAVPLAPARPSAKKQSPPAPAKPEVVEVPRDDEAVAEKKVRSRYDSDSAIKLYLREIGKVPLLTPQEEIELAARIKQGDEEAREHMIKANLRLVVKIAHDYDGLGLPLLDLINEGNMGLMKAVERFDPAKGGKLSTYGAWWIKQSIKRALANQSKTIRLPVHLVDKISRMRRVAMRLQEALGREPTDAELAEEMDMTPARVAQLRRAAIRPTSLDAPIGDDDSNTYAEVVADDRAEDPYEQLEEKTVTHLLGELIEQLDERERAILRHRFGLDGGREKTLEEVGEEFGVTRERIRQIQNLALAKLRRMIEKIEGEKR